MRRKQVSVAMLAGVFLATSASLVYAQAGGGGGAGGAGSTGGAGGATSAPGGAIGPAPAPTPGQTGSVPAPTTSGQSKVPSGNTTTTGPTVPPRPGCGPSSTLGSAEGRSGSSATGTPPPGQSTGIPNDQTTGSTQPAPNRVPNTGGVASGTGC